MELEQTRAVMSAYWDGDSNRVGEDVTFHLLPIGEVTRGREAFLARRAHFYDGLFTAKLEDIHTCIGADHAVMEGTLAGVLREPFAGATPTGALVRLPMCVSYDLEDGRIIRVRAYVQTEGLRAA
jgi:hypothetical protein